MGAPSSGVGALVVTGASYVVVRRLTRDTCQNFTPAAGGLSVRVDGLACDNCFNYLRDHRGQNRGESPNNRYETSKLVLVER